MSEAFPPEEFLREVQVRHDELCTQGRFDREGGLIRVIRRTASALAGEFGRLEAIHKEKGADELWIPHGEKAKLYELAVDLGAQCMLLCEGSIQADRTAQRILDGIWNNEDVEIVTHKLGEITDTVLEERKRKEAEEKLLQAQEEKQRLEEDIAKAEEKVKQRKKGKKQIGIEGGEEL